MPPEKRISESNRSHRRTDLWPVIKSNLAPIVLVLSLFGSIIGVGIAVVGVTEFLTSERQEAIKFVIETVNPEKMAEWRKRRAETKASVKATKDLSNRRWCMTQKLAAKADTVAMMACLNEKSR